MDEKQWDRVREAFHRALDVVPNERSAFLQAACSDPEIRAQVEALLAGIHTNVLDTPAIQGLREAVKAAIWHGSSSRSLDATEIARQEEAGEGSVIARYRLLQKIGEGGMGEVWLAEQREPVRRRVALKLIKAGMNTREVIARFESERQALALMDHPAIAKVLDAGSTPEGTPYFVMEYVAGIPITTYCDNHKLTTRERLELFSRVCEGVQHAHQKAIIHRDLKPSNILVTELDGKPMPKIIDFGIAKATAQRLTADTIYTRIGAVIGTLAYISPEQANSGGEDIDTRSDVYSLGVVLYELLVGALPFDFRKVAYDEALRQLREQDPLPPSSKLLTLGDQSATLARCRAVDPSTLRRQLRRDADAIALKALEKERARRYGTPSEMASDIGRYLRNEPVTAHAPGVAYRLGKYIRRHSIGAAAVLTILTLLIASAILQSVQLRQTRRERDNATRERTRADRVAQFMTKMFEIPYPSAARGNTVTAREILDKASQDIETGLRKDPELQAKMMYIMASTYFGLGLYSRAETLVGHALAIQRRVLGSGHPDTLASMELLAPVLNFQRRSKEAERIARDALDGEVRVHGQADWRTLGAKSLLANALTGEGRYAEAEKLYREVLANQVRTLGPENPDTAWTKTVLAQMLDQTGRYAEEEQLAREALDVQRRVAPEGNPAQRSMMDLASALMNQGRYAEAEPLFRNVLEIRIHILGPQHPQTLFSIQAVGIALSHEGRYVEAEKLFREAIQSSIAANQPTVWVWYNFACAAAIATHKQEALKYLKQAIDNGYTAADQMAVDSDLQSLHGDARFDALIARARQTAAAKAH